MYRNSIPSILNLYFIIIVAMIGICMATAPVGRIIKAILETVAAFVAAEAITVAAAWWSNDANVIAEWGEWSVFMALSVSFILIIHAHVSEYLRKRKKLAINRQFSQYSDKNEGI